MQLEENVSLKPYNTFGLNQTTRYLVHIRHESELPEALDFAQTENLPLLILGAGSNVLLTKDWEGLVIRIAIKGVEVLEENEDYVRIKVGAGENWHDFVLYCISKGWGGVENLSLIPGTVGASPMQNIGAYGVEIKSVFEKLEAVKIENGDTKTFLAEECCLGYRDSVFKQSEKGNYIITRVVFKLSKKPIFNTSYGDIENTLHELGVTELSLQGISDAVTAIRRKKLPDPSLIGNAGSFFKNPVIPADQFQSLKAKFPSIPGFAVSEGVKVPAAWLIEQAGWKGKRWGTIGVHDKQPLVLVNYGEGKGRDLLFLSKTIAKEVFEKFGIELQTEVNLV